MKIAITGAGAMGSAFAWLLQGDDREIAIYEKSPLVVDQIEKNGLTIYAGGEGHNINPTISHSPEILAGASLILIMVKSYSTEKLMEEIAPYIDSRVVMVSLQNGLGNREIMEKYLNSARILMGTTTVGATKTSPQEVRIIGLGEVMVEQKPEYSSIIEKTFASSGLEITVSPDAEKILFEKAILNSAINCLGALYSLKNGELLSNPHCLSIMDNIIDEITSLPEVARMGIGISYMKEKTRAVCQNTAENRCSMLQDMDNGRPTEIDFINGYFLKIAARAGMELPMNSTMVNEIKALEQK